VLLQIHGGGWMQNCGNKDQQGLVLMNQMAEKGWVCVAIEYRLSPKVAFPSHIIDCKRALAWVKENIKDYGGNPDFVVVTGGSAGGHLSSLLALSANAPQFQPGFESTDTSVRACVPFYGVMDFTDTRLLDDTLFEQHLSTRVIKKSYAEAPELWKSASPVQWVNEDNTLPFLIIHGAADTLVPVSQSKALYQALRESGSEQVGYAELEDAQHAFDLSISLRSQIVIHYVEHYLTGLHGQYQAVSIDEPLAAKNEEEELYAPPA
ncbi:MAG: alpha/beta hydrolase fold domain-containing protein, partial [Spongiibacteraceae bacterium]